MAFRISRNPTYQTQIVVSMPGNNGKRETEKFMAEFKHVGTDRLDELRSIPHREVLNEVLVGWSGMIDDNGDEVPFNEVNRKIVYDIPQALDALIKGFWTSIFGASKGN